MARTPITTDDQLQVPNPARLAPAAPTVPGYNGLAPYHLPAEVAQNVSWLMNPGSTYDVDQRAAEANLGRGTAGSAFGVLNTYNLRDQDRIQRVEAANKILEPYVQRYQDMHLEGQREAAQLAAIAAQGDNAMKQLQAEQGGRAALQSEAERAQAERDAALGQQALEQLRVKGGFETQQQAAQFANAVQLENLRTQGALAQTQLETASRGDIARAEQAAADSRLRQQLDAELARTNISEAGATARQQAQLGESRYATNLGLITNLLSKYGLTGNNAGSRSNTPQGTHATTFTSGAFGVPVVGDLTPLPTTTNTYSALPNYNTILQRLGLH